MTAPRWATALALALSVSLTLSDTAHAVPELRVELPPAAPRVGDPVTATLVLTIPAAELTGEPRFPAWQKTWGEAEILQAGAITREDVAGSIVLRQSLTIAAFAPGPIGLPAQKIVVPASDGSLTLETPAGLQLQVRSVLPPDVEKPEPKPPAPLQPLPLGERFWWSLAVGLLLCLAAATMLWRRQRAAAGAAAEVAALSPLAELRAALAALLEQGRDTGLEAAHTRLSFALRRYLGRTLRFPAVESTTTEIARELRARRTPGGLVAQAGQVLRDCDGVKFAREQATAATLESRIARAGALAAELEAQLAAPPVPANNAAAQTSSGVVS